MRFVKVAQKVFQFQFPRIYSTERLEMENSAGSRCRNISKYSRESISSCITRCDRICFVQVVKRGELQREIGLILLREIYFLRADIDFGYFCSIALVEYLVKREIVSLFFLITSCFSRRDFAIKISWKLRLPTIVIIVVIFIKWENGNNMRTLRMLAHFSIPLILFSELSLQFIILRCDLYPVCRPAGSLFIYFCFLEQERMGDYTS